jgi:hypothetical protein
MALLDLSLVSETLMRLVDESIKISPAWPGGQTADVSSLPPDLLAGDNSLGIYMYHLSEEAAYKNQTWPDRPQPPMRFSPMGINLYYVVSARSALAASLGPLREQLLMGLAVKALHDRPVIDDSTMVNGVTILHPNLRAADNPLKIELRNVPPNEAVSYWTAGSQPLRLSAYYEIRVVLLEPDEPTLSANRVLMYGIDTMLGGQPRLETSRSAVTFRIPGESADRIVEAQPAAAAPTIGGVAGTEITFRGANLAGDAVGLLVRAQAWSAPEAADAAWGVVAGGDRIFATPQTTASGRAVLPGAYTAVARVVRSLPLPDGTVKSIEQLSNQVPFTVVPAVNAVSAIVGGVFTATGGTFQHPELDSAAVRAYIGETQLVTGTASSLAPGEFAVTGPTTLQMRFPAAAAVGTFAPVRVMVNGAESFPRWIGVA